MIGFIAFLMGIFVGGALYARATQYALLSALASVPGRFLTGTTAGTRIDPNGGDRAAAAE